MALLNLEFGIWNLLSGIIITPAGEERRRSRDDPSNLRA